MNLTLHKSHWLNVLMLVCTMLVGNVSGAWAETKTSTLTFTAKCNGSGTADDNVVWTITSDATESTFDSSKGIHYGTNNAAVSNITLTTTGITGAITKVVVNASTAKDVTATVDVTVNGSAFGGNAQSLSSTATDYTFEGSAQGPIEVTVKKPESYIKALYVKSVAVTYETASATTCSTPAITGTTPFLESTEVSIACGTEGASIQYSTDGTTWNDYTVPFTLTETTTVQAKATKEGLDDSEVASKEFVKATPYTVAEARAAIDAGTGVTGVYATGIVSAIPTAYSTQYGNITFNIVDATGDTEYLQAYRCTGDEAANVAIGDIVVVYGNLKNYNSTYEFEAGCQLISRTAAAVVAPTFTPAAGTFYEAQSVTISCEDEDATVKYSFDNATWQDYTAAITVSGTTTIYAKAVKGGVESTVVSAAYIIKDPYTKGGPNNPYTVAEALAADPQENAYVSGIVCSYPSGGGVNTLQGFASYNISDDGENTNYITIYKGKYLNNEAFTSGDQIAQGDEVVVCGNIILYSGVNEFATGNYLVSLTRPVVPIITLAETHANLAATIPEGESYITASIELTFENYEGDEVKVAYCDADGVVQTTSPYTWITIDINTADGKKYVSGHAFQTNTGEARTAYAKVYVTVDGRDYYSNLISFTQAAPAVPSFELGFNYDEYPATLESIPWGGTSSYTVNNYEGTDDAKFTYCDADGNPLDDNPYAEWFDSRATSGSSGVTTGYIEFYIRANNTSTEPRFGYVKLYVEVDGVKYYSDLITIKQKGVEAPVVDYAELPFEWEGGVSADLLALDGVTADGLGSDYAEANAPYRVKLDGNNDYIQVKTNERPGIVTIGVKMLGGGNTSYITVQESADGETFSDVQQLTISGAQNDILTLSTNTAFAETSRYVRLLFTKGSNVGVGPITIAQYADIVLNDYTLAIANAENVTITANYGEEVLHNGDNAEVTEGTEVTIAITPAEGFDFESVTVAGEEEGQTVALTENATTSGVYTFTMPAFAVTISATVVEHVEPTYTTYALATSITSGKTYIIASSAEDGEAFAMGEQKNNNRGAGSINIADGVASVASDAGVHEFVIAGDDTEGYTIYDDSAESTGYLYAASSSANQLKTQAENDVNGVWTITISSDGEASVVAEGSTNRNVMQYNVNNSSPLFACYASASQSPVYIYEKVDDTLLGDVNKDGSITIADVTALVNIILGKDTEGQYDHDAADVNGDESVTIADVTALVNIILGKTN